MRYVADDVAAKVHGQLPKLTYRRDVRLDARYDEPVLRWRLPTEKERKWAAETLETHPAVRGRLIFRGFMRSG